MSYQVFDVETTIRSEFKRKATPFGDKNVVVAVGNKRKADLHPVGSYTKAGHHDGWFAPLLSDTKFLVGFNEKFDILHALAKPHNRAAWIDFINDGGQLWDCQLGEYLLHGQAQEVQMISLDETVVRYGGSLKNDAVKGLWEAGVDTTEIDRDMLMDYLVGTMHRTDVPADQRDYGDIGNTEKVFLGQVPAFRARGSLQSALLNMGALIFTTEAEYNGMYVDKEEGLRLAELVKAEIEENNATLATFLPADLPFEFSWGNRYHLSPLLFGGQVKYPVRVKVLDDEGNFVYFQKDELHYTLTDGTTTATPPDGSTIFNYVTYAGGKNKGEYKTKKVKVPDIERGAKERWEDQFFTFEGVTTPEKKWASSTDGLYSTAAEVIEALGERDIPFLKMLAATAAMRKDLTTYYITTDEKTGEEKGMLTLVGEDGIIHHQLHMNRTITGRLSSSDPNLQNVSGGQKSDVKSVFKSRFGQDGFIVQSDFTALEIYVQATLTNCKQLIEDLRLGMDMHCLRAWQAWGSKEGLTYDQVYEYAVAYGERDDLTAEEKALHKKWKYKRKNAKVFSFQRAYGAGVAKIAATTGMTHEEVQDLIDAENIRYPELAKYVECVTLEVKRNRVPTARFCQHPDVPGLNCQLGRSHIVTPDGMMFSFSESPSPEFIAKKPASQGGTPQSFSPTEIKNYPVQGTGGTWAKAAMWLAARAFYRKKNFGGMALLVNQVHDAIYMDAHKSVYLEAAAVLAACMLEASTLMEFHFNWKIPIGVPTDTKWGASMIEENSFDSETFQPMVAEARRWVRSTFISNHTPSWEKE